MPQLNTWEAYAEFAGGRVHIILKGATRQEAEAAAKTYIDYDAAEMGEPVEALQSDDDSTTWLTAGTICGAYREWTAD